MRTGGGKDRQYPQPPSGWQGITALGILSTVVLTTVIVTHSTEDVDRILTLLLIVRFSHQDLPPTDGYARHHHRSAPCASRALIAGCGSSRRGAAIEVADDPLQP